MITDIKLGDLIVPKDWQLVTIKYGIVNGIQTNTFNVIWSFIGDTTCICLYDKDLRKNPYLLTEYSFIQNEKEILLFYLKYGR